MVLCNQRSEGVLECVNGDMGVVAGFGASGEAEVHVRLDNGKSVTIAPHVWEKTAYSPEIDPKTNAPVMRRNVIGSFEQIPLRLAYAITIHKSQGLSFDCVSLRQVRRAYAPRLCLISKTFFENFLLPPCARRRNFDILCTCSPATADVDP